MSPRPSRSLLVLSLLAAAATAQTVGPGSQSPDTSGFGAKVLAPTTAELAGQSLAGYPHFQHVRVIHEGGAVELGVDPLLVPAVAGISADVYVVAARTTAGWQGDRLLVDVRAGGAQPVTFTASGIQSNTVQLDAGTLSGNAGTGLGVGYDVVVDVNLNGVLDDEDVIDGLGDEAGFYVVADTTQPGPLATVEITYSGGSFLGQNTFYPANIATLGKVPLVVVSHGNGHDYRWYDHIGHHLASYGYVVMSHQNNTGPGSSFASLTTLSNTEYILANQATIGGGVLDGHIQEDNILWIGHSRGGEGVVRAYTRLLNDEWTSTYFDEDDIQMVLSIAPVTHISSSLSFPDDTNFILMYGSSDADVSGSPSSSSSKPFAFYERAFGYKHVFYVQGAGHAYFHNGGGSCVCTGPSTLSLATVHDYELGYVLPLVKRYADGNVPALDFFERMDGDLRPAGLAASVVASKEYREPLALGHFVIDDFQTQTSLGVSSSGAAVTRSVFNAVEGLMRDQDGSFNFSAAVPMNGMTRYDDSGDDGRALVFDWPSPGSYFLEFAVPTAAMDMSDDAYLSFRACQGTRHPETDLLDGPVEFTVTLRDTGGTTSSIRTGLYGDITRTYERTGSGSGAGWANEFSTVRLRLTDFLVDGSGLDLTGVEAVRFEFGAGFGSVRGRLGFDDLEIVSQ
jgi:hypothetical protein